MASEELKQLRNVLTQEAIREHQMAKTGGTSSDMFQCSKCRKKNCTYNQVNTHTPVVCNTNVITVSYKSYDRISQNKKHSVLSHKKNTKVL